MKRLLCLLLAVGCLFALAGCRSREERQEMRRQLDYASGKLTYTPEGDRLDDGTTLEQQVFYEDHGITCTLLGIYEEEDYYCLPYSVRNDSRGEADVSLDAVTLNGWNVSLGNSWVTVVSKGMDYGVYQLYKEDLPSGAVLGSLSTLQLFGTVYCDEGSDGSIYEDFTAQVSTSNPPSDSATELPGQLIYEDDRINVTYLGLEENSWAYEFYFAVENKTSGYLYLSQYYEQEDAPCEAAINGSPLGDMWYLYSANLAPGTKGVLTMEVYYDDLDAMLGIQRADEITQITIPCQVDPEELRSYAISLELDLTQP